MSLLLAAGGPAAAELTAAVTCTAAVSAQLTTAITAAASVTGTATVPSAVLTTAITAAAAVTGTASTAGALTTEIRLAAAVTGTATTSAASLTTAIPLDAAASGTATAAGSLTTAITLAAAVSATGSTVADLTAPSPALIEASVTATATTAAALYEAPPAVLDPEGSGARYDRPDYPARKVARLRAKVAARATASGELSDAKRAGASLAARVQLEVAAAGELTNVIPFPVAPEPETTREFVPATRELVDRVALIVPATAVHPKVSPERRALYDLVLTRQEAVTESLIGAEVLPALEPMAGQIEPTPEWQLEVEHEVRDTAASKAFTDRIVAALINGRALAMWAAKRDGLPVVRGASFADPPEVFSPTKAVEYWTKVIPLDAQEAELLLASLNQFQSVAFAIAGEWTQAVLHKVAEIFAKAIRDGMTLSAFRKLFADVIPGQAKHLVETIYRTNLGKAYAASRIDTIKAAGIRVPFIQFMSIPDDRRTPVCTAMSGYIAATGDSIWDRFTPPLHFNCFAPETEVRGEFNLASRVSYGGPVVEIETARGNRLTVTPNHPIATPTGFKAAGELSEGDDVLSCTERAEFSLPFPGAGGKDKEHLPSRIDQVFVAFAERGSVTTTRRAKHDLHSDAIFGKGDIYVACVEGVLLDQRDATLAQEFRDFILKKSDAPEVSFSRHGALHDDFRGDSRSATLSPSASHLSLDAPPVGFNGGPLQSLRFGASANMEALFAQTFHNRFPSNGKLFCELIDRSASDVQAGDFIGLDLESPAMRDNASALKSGVNRLGIDPVFPGNVSDPHAPLVVADKIARINRKSFVGHVFDLQSKSGFVIANNILASNCRSDLSPVGYLEAIRRGIAAYTPDRRGLILTRGTRPNGDPPKWITVGKTIYRVEPAPGFGGSLANGVAA